MTTPIWVDAEQVVAINRAVVASTPGERHLLRNLGAMESAVARPENYLGYTDDVSISSLAAELMFGIGKAHAFEQGNKRTAWAAGQLLAYLNGHRIDVPRGESQLGIAMAVEKAVTVDLASRTLALLIEPWLRPIG